MFEIVIARSAAIACGHKGANDLDRLRHDPLMKITVGRCPQSGAALASQSTISRLENAFLGCHLAEDCALAIPFAKFRHMCPDIAQHPEPPGC